MRILLLVHSFNSLAQRLFVELAARGHDLSVEFDINDAVSLEADTQFQPDLILAPFLKRAIPERLWRRRTCLAVHPGPPGDRGPSALDWAILKGEATWGVTVLQANAEFDAGPIWASAAFSMRPAAKSSLYRNEITEAAVSAVLKAVERFAKGEGPPQEGSSGAGNWRPHVRPEDRAIDWCVDSTDVVLRKIRSADGVPGVEDELFGRRFRLFDAQEAPHHSGSPGDVIARSGPAVCRATKNGAVWIGALADRESEYPFKRPATQVLADSLAPLPDRPIVSPGGYREIWYEERGDVGYLHFAFYNGAMDTGQCRRLLKAYRQAVERSTRVIVLMGGHDFWSNGIHLNLIEAADSPADESWENINAMDDLAEAIIRTESHLTVAALQGNAGAGGVFLARAADRVWLRRGVVLNPHYKDMGNLYGSEFWTYLLPRFAGRKNAERIVAARLPMGADEAQTLGLADAVLAADRDEFRSAVQSAADSMAKAADFSERLMAKAVRRASDEREKPLSAYREEELARMRLNFFGFDPSYHVARYKFVHKVPKSRTPATIAVHRQVRDDLRTAS
jgi:putative two-component system hydrogenase maturation factor HypX/HoxX